MTSDPRPGPVPSVLLPPHAELAVGMTEAGLGPENAPDGLYAAVLTLAGRNVTGEQLGRFLADAVRAYFDSYPPVRDDQERAGVQAVHDVLIGSLSKVVRAVVADEQVAVEALAALSPA